MILSPDLLYTSSSSFICVVVVVDVALDNNQVIAPMSVAISLHLTKMSGLDEPPSLHFPR